MAIELLGRTTESSRVADDPNTEKWGAERFPFIATVGAYGGGYRGRLYFGWSEKDVVAHHEIVVLEADTPQGVADVINDYALSLMTDMHWWLMSVKEEEE